jgi:hypothetical protein
MPSQPKQLSFKGNVGIHRPFDKIPETGTQELFNETPVSLQATPVPQQGTGAPKQIESPVHEVPAPMKVIPGPVQVSLEQWLQIVEKPTDYHGRRTAKPRFSQLIPVQKRKTDPWVQWNTQMDAQPARME